MSPGSPCPGWRHAWPASLPGAPAGHLPLCSCMCPSLVRHPAPSLPRWTLGRHADPWVVLSLLPGPRAPVWWHLPKGDVGRGPLLGILSEDCDKNPGA